MTMVQIRDTFVYRCFDRHGELLYVGVTSTPRARWWGHRAKSPWASQVATCRMVGPFDRSTALEYERDAIRHERPKHNTIRVSSAAGSAYRSDQQAIVRDLVGDQPHDDIEQLVDDFTIAYGIAADELDRRGRYSTSRAYRHYREAIR